jgi:hypothetical protein
MRLTPREEGVARSSSWPNGLVITIIIIIIIISTSGYYSTTYSTAVAAVCNDSKNYIMETKR